MIPMPRIVLGSSIVLVLGGLACGDAGEKTPRDTDSQTTDVTRDEPTTTPPDAAPDADTSEPAPPNIALALDCGDAPPEGPGNSNELQRFEIDIAKFPDAICNDGRAAVFFFRPYVGEENRDRWLINLNGGGFCGTGPACAARWCWCRSTSGPEGCPFAETTTNFSMGNMTPDERASTQGSGITLRGDEDRPNPIGDYNQVRLVYCSSDAWAGTRRAVPFDVKHPKSGADVAYSIHFLGSRILDAALATLRADGVASPHYTGQGGARDLPDLDDASEVILSGDSGGGSGVINNLDRVATMLRAANSKCSGASCALVVRGLIDAIVGPELARLDFSESVFAELGGATYDAYLTYLGTVPQANQGSVKDESCLTWHTANAPGTEAECRDETHIIRHHVTTPFFVRMALLDQLISGNYIEAGYADPELGKMTLAIFARVLQRELSEFPKLPDTAEEGDAMTVAPGVFAPACPKHDTIHHDGEVYETTITPDGGTALTLLPVFENWRQGKSPSAVLTSKVNREDTSCAP